MKYILKNKDIVVLEFDVESEVFTLDGVSSLQESIVSLDIKNKDLLPLNFNQNYGIKSLYKWIESRKIPKNRENSDKILLNANIDASLMGYIKVSLGLSLNDSFWIVPSDKNYKWKDFNLYDNKFDVNLELIAFGISPNSNSKGISPEYTTNGMLKKCWHRENDGIFLYKGSSKLYENPYEAYSEFYSAQIADIMDFEYVPYDLKKFHGHLVSSCKLFTNENEGFVSMRYCLKNDIIGLRQIKLVMKIAEIYGKDKLNDLMLFDALICNIDRHLGNFGMIINNNTNEILRPAPIFDNGLSMIKTLSKDDLRDIKEALRGTTSAFNFTFDEQLKIAVQPRHIPNLEKLAKFEFKKHKEFNLSDEWLEAIQIYVQNRAKLALQFAYDKQVEKNENFGGDKVKIKKLQKSLKKG